MKAIDIIRERNEKEKSLSEDEFLKWMEKQAEMRKTKFPIEVNHISFDKKEPVTKSLGMEQGQLVCIRPCGDEYKGKTYLGINIGDLPLSVHVSYNKETKELTAGFGFTNPAFFVPELKKVIFGAESWWSKIRSEEDFKDITDETIQSQWYVQLLQSFAETSSEDVSFKRNSEK